MKGKVYLDNQPQKDISVYESDKTGIPLRRNNKYNYTTTNNLSEYNIDVIISPNHYLTFRLVGAEQKTLPTNNIPTIINLKTSGNLEEIEVKAKKTYWWLLFLLIPAYYIYKSKK